MVMRNSVLVIHRSERVNIVGASSLNMVVMIDIDGKHFWRFSP